MVLGTTFETSSTGMLKGRNKMKEQNLKEVLIDRKWKEKMNSWSNFYFERNKVWWKTKLTENMYVRKLSVKKA